MIACNFIHRLDEDRGFVVVEDLDQGKSVTNDAEAVMARLTMFYPNLLVPGWLRVVYRDTDGRWDEITHRRGRFVSFRPLAAKTVEEAMDVAKATFAIEGPPDGKMSRNDDFLDAAEVRVTPYQAFGSGRETGRPEVIGYRIWQRGGLFGFEQRHEYAFSDGSTRLEPWIRGVHNWLRDAVPVEGERK